MKITIVIMWSCLAHGCGVKGTEVTPSKGVLGAACCFLHNFFPLTSHAGLILFYSFCFMLIDSRKTDVTALCKVSALFLQEAEVPKRHAVFTSGQTQQ